MKTINTKFNVIAFLMITIFFSLSGLKAESQILKKIGKKIEKSVDKRIDRKIDKGVEKSLDQVEDGVDKSVKDATKENPKTSVENDAGQQLVEYTPYSEADAEKAKANNGLILVSANCNDFAWFKKGAVLEFEITTANVSDPYSSKIEVKNVRNEGKKTIADILASDHEGNEFEMNYLCSGNKLYFDLTNMLKSAMEKQGQSADNMDVSFDGGLMEIPKNIYPGQKLEDAVFTMNMATQGMTISMTSFLKERQVVGTEKVTTPAGTFQCIKITGIRTMQMKMMGRNRKIGDPVIEEMYFAPSIGVVKSVSKTQKGDIESSQQLTSYRL